MLHFLLLSDACFDMGSWQFAITFVDENSAHLVELYLDVDITKFTEENKVTENK